jgi:hypothetical protein
MTHKTAARYNKNQLKSIPENKKTEELKRKAIHGRF